MRARVLALVALAGCSAPDYIMVDQRFTPEEEQLIRGAAGDWQIATGRRIDLVFGQSVDTDVTSLTSSMVRVTSRLPVVAAGLPWAGGTTKRSIGNARVMIVVDTLQAAATLRGFEYPDLFRYTVQHELGHWLGLEHVRDPNAVMHWSAPDVLPGCITTTDAAEFCRVTDGCRPETMRGCP